MPRFFHLVLAIFLGVLAQGGRAQQPAGVEAYAALPAARSPRLSPEGRFLAQVEPVQGRDAVVIRDLDGRQKPVVLPTADGEPLWLAWKSEKRLILALRTVSWRVPLRPTVETRLVALDADGTKVVELVQGSQFAQFVPQLQDKIVSLLPGDDKHILLELPATDRRQLLTPQGGASQVGSLSNRVKYPEIVKVDTDTGRVVSVAQQQRPWVTAWRADADGVPRIALAQRDASAWADIKGGDGVWHSVQHYEKNQGRVFAPLDFVPGAPTHVYAFSNHDGKAGGLYEFDFVEERFVATIAAGPQGTPSILLRDGRLVGYRFPADAPPTYLDADYAREAAVINRGLPGRSNMVLDRAGGGRRVLMRSEKGNEPLAYWLLERDGGKPELSPLADTYPGVAKDRVAATRIIRYLARDGLSIPALLTLPIAYRQGDRLPFIVLPHGGPTAHDAPGFDYLVQFLASRGYGVLQPQFRGSTGYGAAFEAAGLQQWGLAMQDDVTDGTRWLLEQGLAEPGRIAIVGASYGGYAALMGAVKEPALYRAAVAIAPVTDLNLLVEDWGKLLFGDVNVPRIGTDPNRLEQTSPDRQAERIRVPLLLIHGRKDFTVPVIHTERMAEALTKAGKTAEVIYLADADHYLSRGADRLAALSALEKFLAAQLPLKNPQ